MTAIEPKAKDRLKWRDLAIIALIIVVVAPLTVFGLSFVSISNPRNEEVVLIINIQNAVQAYETEYDEMPDISNHARLIKVLSGDNLRKIQFIALRPSELSPSGQVIDEWGTPLRISIGSDSKVHVSSAGKDGIFGTKDDVAY